MSAGWADWAILIALGVGVDLGLAILCVRAWFRDRS